MITIERGATAAPCSCGGYGDEVDTTEAEDSEFGCGGPRCCARAFVCRVCKARFVAKLDAPEME